MKRLILSLILLLSQAFFVFASVDTPQELLEKAKTAYNNDQNKKAFELFTMAKDAGEYDALAYLADMYANGYSVRKDLRKCKTLLEEGVEKGSLLCMNDLGSFYLNGKLGSADYKQAEKYFSMAAIQGYALAQRNLGVVYEIGDVGVRDYHKAGLWYKTAAINGKTSALKDYVDIVEKGYNISDEEAQAFIQSGYTDYNPVNSGQIQQPAVAPVTQVAPVVNPVGPVPGNLNTTSRKSPVDISIPSSGIVSENTFAVIIANENYTSVSKVDYAANDGEVFSQYCHKTLGIPENHILMKKDATFGAMESVLSRLEKIGSAYDGDLNVIFYYAGHGIPDEKTRDSFLIPVDGDGSIKSTCLKTSSVYKRLSDINAKSVIVFMDACFSGSARGDAMLASARGVRIAPKDEKIGGRMVVFTASHGDETAYPYEEQGHGLFTYYLLKKIQETSGDVKLGDMMDYIQSSVKKESIVSCGQMQTPTVVFSGDSSDWRNWNLIR